MKVRLCVMMLLEYAIIGSWAPVFGVYMNFLGIGYSHKSLIWATAALGSVLAPQIWGQIADRWLPAERCISVCASACGLTLWTAAYVTEPIPLFWLFLVFWLFMMPTLSLGAALTFRHLEHPEREFGPIRMWGTVGWMAAGWGFTGWLHCFESFDHTLVDSFRWGAISAWTLAIYAFTLPPTPPLKPRVDSPAAQHRWFDATYRALKLFRVPAFAVYCVCLFTVYVSWPFNMQLTQLLMKELLRHSDYLPFLPLVMTIAQLSEVLALFMLPRILERLGQKRTMIVGIVSWVIALTVLASGLPLWVVASSLLLHGLFICCFLVAGQVFINKIAHHDFRASAQGLIVLITGLGQIVGNFAVSELQRRWSGDNYPRTFVPAAVGISLLAVFFIAAFRPPRS